MTEFRPPTEAEVAATRAKLREILSGGHFTISKAAGERSKFINFALPLDMAINPDMLRTPAGYVLQQELAAIGINAPNTLILNSPLCDVNGQHTAHLQLQFTDNREPDAIKTAITKKSAAVGALSDTAIIDAMQQDIQANAAQNAANAGTPAMCVLRQPTPAQAL